MNDIEPMVELGELDPGHRDPGYWTRFHARVMASVAPQLALRMHAPITVGDALQSWSRLVLPFAAVAAAVAGLLLFQTPETDDLAGVAALEELLHQTEGEAALPAFLYREAEVDRDMVLLALEEF